MNKSKRKNRNRKRNNNKKKTRENELIEEITMLRIKINFIQNSVDERIEEMKESDEYIDIIKEKENLETKVLTIVRLIDKVNILQIELNDIIDKQNNNIMKKTVTYTEDEINELKKICPTLQVVDCKTYDKLRR